MKTTARIRIGRAGVRAVTSLLIAVAAIGSPGGVAVAEAPPAQPLGCWATERGERFEFARGEDGVLRVQPVGVCEAGSPGPIDTSFVAETGRTCFWAPTCASGVDAYCFTPGASADQWILIRRAWDHSRILRDRSRGSHPLRDVSSEPLERCAPAAP